MAEKLLWIEGVTIMGGRGLLLDPFIPLKEWRGGEEPISSVELRFPNGKTKTFPAEAFLTMPASSTLLVYCIFLQGPDTQHDIPMGTEVWTIDDSS